MQALRRQRGLCEHGRVRSACKECGGSGICEHGRWRHKCKDCRCARAEADTQEKAAAALAAVAALEGERDGRQRQQRGISSVQRQRSLAVRIYFFI